MRIGVFGGSFDPVHFGHLIAAECCREQAGLDRVLFMPAAVPPHKQDRQLSPAADRVEMLRLAVGGHDAFAVSTLEIDRGGVSFTVDTLALLHETHPADELFLLLGPDAIVEFPTWREPARILDLAGACSILSRMRLWPPMRQGPPGRSPSGSSRIS
jgi:nicotinate-nucleotide adenylyltransferase